MRTAPATFHGSPCGRNHGTLRLVSNRECVECRKDQDRRAKARSRAERASGLPPAPKRPAGVQTTSEGPRLCSCGDPAQAGSYFCSDACQDAANWEFSAVASPFLSGGSGR